MDSFHATLPLKIAEAGALKQYGGVIVERLRHVIPLPKAKHERFHALDFAGKFVQTGADLPRRQTMRQRCRFRFEIPLRAATQCHLGNFS